MGTGNKLHPELLKISKLKNTCYDPLAKKIRKTNKLAEYDSTVDMIFASKELYEGRIEL